MLTVLSLVHGLRRCAVAHTVPCTPSVTGSLRLPG